MREEARNRKRNKDEAEQPSKHEGIRPLTGFDEWLGRETSSRFFVSEDDGIQIPGAHPFYNLSVDTQLLILELPQHRLDYVIDYIGRTHPTAARDDESL